MEQQPTIYYKSMREPEGQNFGWLQTDNIKDVSHNLKAIASIVSEEERQRANALLVAGSGEGIFAVGPTVCYCRLSNTSAPFMQFFMVENMNDAVLLSHKFESEELNSQFLFSFQIATKNQNDPRRIFWRQRE